jgi:hypothetical protein
MLDYFANFVHAQAIVSVVFLIAFLLATTALQQRTSKQASHVLDTLPPRVQETEIFGSARRYFGRREVGNLFTSGPHIIPIWFLVIVVAGCATVCYFGAELISQGPTAPNYVLGGIRATESLTTETEKSDLRIYQSQTVFVLSMAFLAAYVWMIHQLVNRINNDDMNPITYYFLSVRLLAAILMAAISRHAVEGIPVLQGLLVIDKEGQKYPAGLAILAFLVGWNPTLWVDELLIKIRDLLKTAIPSQRWPKNEDLPTNMSLLMLQGMVPDKVDRLNELNIENVQKLSSENPIVLWARTSYTLDLILDFIGQAQLALLYEGKSLALLRGNGIRDIWGYALILEAPEGPAQIERLLDVPQLVANSHLERMHSCPTLARLSQLRASLLPVRLPTDALPSLPADASGGAPGER